jgi:radical SAM superfamily enzyme YgiQ (UPF0313 family)
MSARANGDGDKRLRLLLINPRNAHVKLHDKANRWNKYRVWKPLGLLVLAGLTPRDWDITVIDENIDTPDYLALPRPDLVGLTAFTSQAPRAYDLAAGFRQRGIPVVMGGIHATFCEEEARSRVDAVVIGEAESVWAEVLEDAALGKLTPTYRAALADMAESFPARHDLLPDAYYFGSIQTTRGCPLDCSFCSVSAFNGRTYRRRPIREVISEFEMIQERFVLVVDDNLIGTRRDHIARAKSLFRAMIDADLDKRWFCQATINMADDEELLTLARRAGCIGVFIGFESITAEGLVEVRKKYNLKKGRDFRESVRRIQRHHITVAGSFILGLDVDRKGVGHRIAETAGRYGLDFLNVLYLTPLPGTRLWQAMEEGEKLAATDFPEDWQFYTLNHPVIRHGHLTPEEIRGEMRSCMEEFYSLRRVVSRVLRNVWRRCEPKLTLAGNASFRINGKASSVLDIEIERGLAAARKNARLLDNLPAVRSRPLSNRHAHASLDESPARST